MRLRGCFALLPIALLGCSSDAAPKVATAIAALSGDAQSAALGATLPVALTVRITASDGSPVQGVTVSWIVTQGNGSVSAPMSTTLRDGTATTNATLGMSAGPNTFTASALGVPNGDVVFHETGVVGQATAMTALSGLDQSAAVGTPLLAPLQVIVTDSYGNPEADVEVTWAVGSGGGSVPTASTKTLANGTTTMSPTLGQAIGDNTFVATSTGLTNSPITFHATGIAGPAKKIVVSGTPPQTGTAGQMLAGPLSVLVTDEYSNPVAGASVTWAAASGGGSIDPASNETGTNGTASASGTLGMAGGNTFTATVAGVTGSPITFDVTAMPAG